MPFNIGWAELVIILVIVLVIFGPKRLPEVGRSLGKGIREFRKSTSELQQQLTEEKEEKPPVKQGGQAEEQPAKDSEPKNTGAQT